MPLSWLVLQHSPEYNGDSDPTYIVVGKDNCRGFYISEYSNVKGLTTSGVDACLSALPYAKTAMSNTYAYEYMTANDWRIAASKQPFFSEYASISDDIRSFRKGNQMIQVLLADSLLSVAIEVVQLIARLGTLDVDGWLCRSSIPAIRAAESGWRRQASSSTSA